jgi:DNA-binding transcriptional LysR family regulator
MFDWDDARYFLAIHRGGTLSAAGRQLGVNQSTVGRRLESLETRLAARLFLRTRDGYRISPAGEQLLPRVERMEDEAHAIARELAGEARLTGIVRITTGDAFGPRVIAPLVAKFHALYPEIELELDADNRTMNLTKREADIAIRFGRPAERQLVARKVVPFGTAPYCAPRYIAARGRPTAPFEGHDFIGDFIDWTVEARWILAHAARGRISVRTGSTQVQVALAVAGMGIALLPCYYGDEEPGLVRVGPPEPAAERAVWLVMHRDLQHSARVRACADFLVEGLRAERARISGVRRGKSDR